jgi:hypothetical protein
MCTATTTTQTTLFIVKNVFAKVITEGTLSPTNKPSDLNVIITEKALLDAMRTPSPPPEEIQHGLATLYASTFPTAEDYPGSSLLTTLPCGGIPWNTSFLTLCTWLTKITLIH